MSSPGSVHPGGRSHLLLYALLAGAWHLSAAAMVVGFPILVVTLLHGGGHPALIVWAAAMFGMVLLSLRVADRGDAPGRPLPREEAPRRHHQVDGARRTAG